MKRIIICITISLLFTNVALVSMSQRNNIVGTITGMDIDGPGCFFGRSGKAVKFTDLIFFDSGDGAWMNLNGSNVTLTLVRETNSKGKLRVGSRIVKKYTADDISIDIAEVVTKYAAISKFSATFTVRDGNRSQVVRAIGECGD